jgi:hypothetical protein
LENEKNESSSIQIIDSEKPSSSQAFTIVEGSKTQSFDVVYDKSESASSFSHLTSRMAAQGSTEARTRQQALLELNIG